MKLEEDYSNVLCVYCVLLKLLNCPVNLGPKTTLTSSPYVSPPTLLTTVF